METVFSQKAINRIHEVNKSGQFSDLDKDGINVLWFNPELSERNRRVVNNKTHSHTFYEIHFILEGGCVYGMADGRELTAKKDTYIFIPPCVHHRMVSKSEDCKKVSFAFSYVPRGGTGYVFSKEMFVAPKCGWMQAVFTSLSLGLERNNGTALQVFQNVLSLLISFVADKKEETDRTQSQTVPDKRFLRAKSFIEDNAARDISVEEVSAYMYLSAKHLGRIFQENSGMTVAAFIARARCDRAIKLLEDNERSVAEIVEALCFSNEQNFNRFFKRMMGMTPGTYRSLKGKETSGE